MTFHLNPPLCLLMSSVIEFLLHFKTTYIKLLELLLSIISNESASEYLDMPFHSTRVQSNTYVLYVSNSLGHGYDDKA